MARSPILNLVSIIVATGTTLNIAADWIHPIGSRGISHISLLQRIPLYMPVRDPFGGQRAYLYHCSAE
eukprot:980083-Pleurochrysis_carterae.AAC.1